MKRSPLKRTGKLRKRSKRWRPTSAGIAFARDQRQAALERDGWLCVLCAEPAMEVDHIQPLGMGRSRYNVDEPLNALVNLRSLCSPCHREVTTGARPIVAELTWSGAR